VISRFISALLKGEQPVIYGDGEQTRDFVEILEREVMPRYEAPRPADIRHSLADISKARSLGYIPDYSIEDGLKETIRWFRR
jgi:nucleoside-diphosphate-sugar epimerase